MMEILPYVYLAYMFVSLYMLSLFVLIYFGNRRSMFVYPNLKKKYSVSFVVPAWNEESTIENTIEHIFEVDYGRVVEVIVVDNNSRDRTGEIVRRLMKKYRKLKLVNEKKQGKGHALNHGVGIARGEIVAVVDADSYPQKNSLEVMLGFFENEKVGVVTCPVVVRNANTFFGKLQAIEYKVIAFSRKLLDFVDAIYVTPGPMAVYRKKALKDIGGFDPKNLTEDIEATWHLAHAGWDRRMCLNTMVSTTVPQKLRGWFVQRRRWNIGGLQCIKKYWGSIGRRGMLGAFIIPFFIMTTFLGLVGLGIFFYLTSRRMISNFLRTKYSVAVGTPVLTLDDLFITPSILNYLGVVLFILGAVFTLFSLAVLKERILKRENILNLPFYMTVYLIIYPFVMLNAIWNLARGKLVWR
jgi:cellulose synthase/poly-beta-1,6-N-acetylglucosamine synthase-like glycosyltransferase